MNKLMMSWVVFALLQPCSGQAADESDKALDLAKSWQSGDSTVVRSPEGRILFAYGQSQPTVVCAIFQLCDLRLEPGEVVQTVNVGDTQRWDVIQARAGEGELTEDHVVIKPLAPDIRTTLFVGTDRRSYLIELVGTDSDTMGQVGFLYGMSRSARAAFDRQSPNGSSDIEVMAPPPEPVETTIPEAPEPVGREIAADNLSFDYLIEGDRVDWKPIRVFDDGRQTFIDFDTKSVSGGALPVLLINDTDTRDAMVNYRYDTRGRMIVDGLFDSGTLMLGKGGDALKVELTRIDNRRAEQSW